MAGFFLYTIDNDVFTQLTTSPTKKQGDILAGYLVRDLDLYLRHFEDEAEAQMWRKDRNALSALIVERLARPDWYSDLSYDSANMWDRILDALRDKPGKTIGIDFTCYEYESIYWDTAETVEKQGVKIMADVPFGMSGFRYFGKPSGGEFDVFPMYSLYTPDQVKEFLSQIEAVKPYFASLPKKDGVREGFFEGLLPPVEDAAKRERVLWVQTDT